MRSLGDLGKLLSPMQQFQSCKLSSQILEMLRAMHEALKAPAEEKVSKNLAWSGPIFPSLLQIPEQSGLGSI